MIKYQECDTCQRYDITGFVPCADHGQHQLCPRCISAIIGASEEEIRAGLFTDYLDLRTTCLVHVSNTMLPSMDIPLNPDTAAAFAAGYMYRVRREQIALDNLDTVEEGDEPRA